jgi:predicted Zn-dependent protease
VYGIEYGGNVYRFISYTTAAQFDSQKSNFFATTDGFRELTDSDILGIQPVRLQVTKTDRSGTFSSFLPEELPMDITAEELAIVNQVHLDSRIEQGQYLKIPRQ